MGTVTFTFTGEITGPANVISGLFNFGIDGTGDAEFNTMDARTLFNRAELWLFAPESATAACLGLGLLALGIGRRRGRDRTRAKA